MKGRSRDAGLSVCFSCLVLGDRQLMKMIFINSYARLRIKVSHLYLLNLDVLGGKKGLSALHCCCGGGDPGCMGNRSFVGLAC